MNGAVRELAGLALALCVGLGCGARTIDDGLGLGASGAAATSSGASSGSSGAGSPGSGGIGIGVGGGTGKGGFPGAGGGTGKGGFPGAGGGSAGFPGAGGGSAGIAGGVGVGGGSAGVAGGIGMGGGSAGGGASCGKGSGPLGPAQIDDLQDGDSAILPPRQGGWFIADDGTGMTHPLPSTISPFVPDQDSVDPANFASHLLSAGHSLWGALLGVTLHSPGARACPVDASVFVGVRFRIRGHGLVRFQVGIPATTGLEFGGACNVGCYDHFGVDLELQPFWTEQTFDWWSLSQQGWGTRAAFNPAQVMQLQWLIPVSGGELSEVWVDDVAFVNLGPQ
jgi:hypothetical protein